MRLLVFFPGSGLRARNTFSGPLSICFLWFTLLISASSAELITTNALPASSEDPTEIPLERLMTMEVPLVYGASKFPQKQSEAPSSVTIVTGNEIQKYGHQTLADVLRSV